MDVEVLKAQKELIAYGYDIGLAGADGIFGKSTLSAIVQALKDTGKERSNHTQKVVITAGHGGGDPGAVNGNITESDIACDLRNIVAHYLREKGVEVITDGETRTNLPLRDAVKLAKRGDLAIEIHTNASADPTSTGVEALASPHHLKVCQMVCGAIADAMGIKTRGDGGWKPQNSGQHNTLAYVQAGGIVLETFFISNNKELQTYKDKKWLIGKAIADAIAEYIA